MLRGTVSLVLIAAVLLLTDVVCKKQRVTEDEHLWNYREMVNKGAIADFEWREPVKQEEPIENNDADSSQMQEEETRKESDVTEPPHKQKHDEEEVSRTDSVISATTHLDDWKVQQRDGAAEYETRADAKTKPFYPDSITYDESPVDDLSYIDFSGINRGVRVPEYRRNPTTEETCECRPNRYGHPDCRPLIHGCSDAKCEPCIGPQGVRGPPGRTGDDGDRGKPGTVGTPGRLGRPGCRGYRGMKGQPGDPGPDGPAGPVGIQGYEGYRGPVGRTGNPGPHGKPGLRGPPAADGYDGLKGPDGDPGIIGDQGRAGRDGPPGLRGREGPAGDPGDPGRPGVFGCRGNEGEIGKPGLPGDPGEGIKGDKGASCDVSCPQVYYGTLLQSPRGQKGDPGDASRLTGDPKADERTVRNYLKQLQRIKGQTGDRGENYGYPGIPGEKGYPGDLGPHGYPGLPGPTTTRLGSYNYAPGLNMLSDEPRGLPGLPGHPGEKGEPGELIYKIGIPPERGDPGEPGKSEKGERGDRARDGRRGERGRRGDPGCDDVGPAGPPGDPGAPGVGIPGGPGPQGSYGDDGCTGPPGPRGPDGPPGIHGHEGGTGPRGMKGETGDCGCQGPPGAGTEGSAPYVYARHSQSNISPGCRGHTLLWHGYSLLHFEANARTHVQDLGAAGSCLKQFDPMPFMFCNSIRGCGRIRRKSSSYWLSSGHIPTTLPTTNLTEIEQMIGRCSVCETRGPALTKHSQSRIRPGCPHGWDFLWAGYSFVMHAVVQRGGGQQMYSPGSCLEKFRGKLYVECNGQGRCHVYGENLGFWLDGGCDWTTVSGEPHCRRPLTAPSGMTILEAEKVVSRCTVCLKI